MNSLKETDSTVYDHTENTYRGSIPGSDSIWDISIMENLPAAIYTCDAKGHITLYNKAAADLWGREPELGKDMWCGSWKIYQPDGITLMDLDTCPMAITLKEGRPVNGREIIIERPDGGRRYVQPYPRPIFDKTGKIAGAVNMLLDITDRKMAEKDLAHLAAIVHSSADPIISKSLTGMITSWNEAAERVFGYTAEEMIGQHISKLIPEDRLNEEPMIIERLKKGEMVEHFETKRVTKDKKLIDISLTISPVKDAGGRVIGASKIVRDITAQRILDETLRESEERLRMAGESTELGTWEFHPITNKITWSDEAKKIYGVDNDFEPTNEFIAEQMHPDDAEYVQQGLEKARDPEGNGNLQMEYRIFRFNDNKVRWLKVRGKVYFNERSQPERLIGNMLDVTDEKMAEQLVRGSELMLNTISNAAPVGLWMTDTNAQNSFVNDTWIKWTGIPFEKHSGTGWLDRVLDEDKADATAKFREAFIRKEKYNTEFRIIRADGHLRWYLTEGAPYYDIDGEFAGYAGSVTDITDIKKMEERKDDFIKMASHELKTPITSIKGYVQLLLNIYDELNEEKFLTSRPIVKSSLNTISKQVSKLTRLVSELLDLSRIESGKLELRKTEFNLASLVEETVQEIRQTTSRHAIIIYNDFEGSIYADKDRISQVLLNLLTNAIKYSPDSESIEVFVKGNQETVTVKVKDQGIGIDKKDQHMIFHRFYRVEGKSEQTYPGFGIGLFIASEIVQRHDGNITVESAKDKGSEFTVTLPLGFKK